MNNNDLTDQFGTLITDHTAAWVTQSQPVQWRPDAWRRHWEEKKIPGAHVLDELAAEYHSQGTIRRDFIFSTYEDRPVTELFIATMVWGSGLDNRGPARTRRILTQPEAASKIADTVRVVRHSGADAGYRAYYGRNRLKNLDVAFITKLLYFAGYHSSRRPRPLIYDSRVATAIVRLPNAPLFPFIADRVTAPAYQRYCTWAENLAEKHHTEPAVIEWSLFELGRQIRNELRK